MIRVDSVSKQFDENLVVDDVSFTVNRGEIFSLLGPNGAGKSTTMRMMIGLVRPLRGCIQIGGYDVHQEPKEVHQRIGVVFELPNLYSRLSVEENLRLFSKLYGTRENRVRDVMEELQLTEKRRQKVRSLSKGWQQRVLIARAILHSPQVLFLDEPTSGLDPNTTRLIHDYILNLKAQGVTILLTTHDMQQADELSDKVAIMHKGRLVALDEPKALKSQYGTNQLRIELRQPGQGTSVILLPLDSGDSAQYLYERMNRGDVISVHSTEASLAQVFQKLTGSELS